MKFTKQNMEKYKDCKHVPYTYILKFTNPHTQETQFYYGMQYAKGSHYYPAAHPDNLWNTYFSSSKHVKELIKKYGKESFEFEIRLIFPNDIDNATLTEHRILKRMNVVNDEKWINKTDNKRCDGSNIDYANIDYNKAKETRKRNGSAWFFEWKKGKTLEELYDKDKADALKEICRQNGLKQKGKKKPKNFGEKISKSLKNKPKSKEHKEKISESLKSKKHQKVICEYCQKSYARNVIQRHLKVCSKNTNVSNPMDKCLYCNGSFIKTSHNKKFCCNKHAQRYRKNLPFSK